MISEHTYTGWMIGDLSNFPGPRRYFCLLKVQCFNQHLGRRLISSLMSPFYIWEEDTWFGRKFDINRDEILSVSAFRFSIQNFKEPQLFTSEPRIEGCKQEALGNRESSYSEESEIEWSYSFGKLCETQLALFMGRSGRTHPASWVTAAQWEPD